VQITRAAFLQSCELFADLFFFYQTGEASHNSGEKNLFGSNARHSCRQKPGGAINSYYCATIHAKSKGAFDWDVHLVYEHWTKWEQFIKTIHKILR